MRRADRLFRIVQRLRRRGATTARQLAEAVEVSELGTELDLIAWCEMRNGFRNFRLDRIDGLEILQDRFESEPGRTPADFLALMAAEQLSAKA
jgi:predicted DNA-binding transcriptional regulator YafY